MPLTNLNISVAANAPSTVVTEFTVAMSGTENVVLLAANSNRMGATIYNNSLALIFVNFAPISSMPSSFAVKLTNDAYYEVPFGYNGAIYGVSVSNNTGNVYVREFI